MYFLFLTSYTLDRSFKKRGDLFMERTIRGKLYNTETADLLTVDTAGVFGDPTGYEERLYRTPDGFYFLYGIGGDQSPYTNETIRCISKVRAEQLLSQ